MNRVLTTGRRAVDALGSEGAWIALICLAALLWFFAPDSIFPRAQESNPSKDSVLFVGDIMLGRGVESLMDLYGPYYPFAGVRDLFAQHTFVVGNFESSIPERHVKTPNFTFRFSVDAEHVPVLARVGITHLSLANNHSYDSGAAGYTHARHVIERSGLAAFGHPNEVGTSSVAYQTVGETRVAFIGLNATYRALDLETMEDTLAEAARESDLQIVSIHWGKEYELSANAAQRTLAHAIIDAGADAIIGHHPHVVQDIEVYRNAPIFYSLGNFVFDQYWNRHVQEGLAVALSFEERALRYDLIPVTSRETRAAPRPMDRVERSAFLSELAQRSDHSLAALIRDGSITTLFATLALE